MPRFECQRCGTRKTANVFYGYASTETLEFMEDRDDIISGGYVIEPDSPDRVCPMSAGWARGTLSGPPHSWISRYPQLR